MKKVSIIIPVYNVEEFLEKCLDSVIQQNFSDYEIICIDDASTDNSREILDAYEKQYDIIHVLEHTENRGLSAARNTGMQHASGKYVWFVDSDDMISLGSLKELYDMAEKNSTDMICFKWGYANDKKESMTANIYSEKEKIYTGKELLGILAYEKDRSDSACIRFLKRSFLIQNQISFYEGLLHEDALFSFFCVVKAERIIRLNKIYYICHRRPTSITAQKTHRSAESNFVIIMQLIVYWYTHCFTERENDAMRAYVLSRYNSYLYYDRFGSRAEKLDVGSSVDKALYDMLYNRKTDKLVALDKTQLEHIRERKDVIVFGADRYAADIIDILNENEIKVSKIAVSSMDYNPTVFCDISVDTIEHISGSLKDDTVIVLGVSLKAGKEVKCLLEAFGYRDVIVPEYKI